MGSNMYALEYLVRSFIFFQYTKSSVTFLPKLFYIGVQAK
jgi:hypothetical protein